MTAATKPVKLQVNTSGAWRDVICFDAAKDVESAEVLGAAETLGRVSKAAFRVVIKDSVNPRAPEVLLRWTADRGWKEQRS